MTDPAAFAGNLRHHADTMLTAYAWYGNRKV